MATQQGIPIDKVVQGGVGLAFVVFPQIINEFPAFKQLFGMLFFASLTLAGLTSLISIIETFVAGIQDKFTISRTKSVLIGGGIASICSLLFATQGGLYFLDVVDYFINNFGVALAGLVEVVLVAWVFKQLSSLQQHANEVSDIRIGSWWKICLGVVTPLVLGYMMFDNFRKNISENYEQYATTFVGPFGWGVAALAVILGIAFSFARWEDGTLRLSVKEKGVSK
jgi:NSS family neurotransmitter:Na+ symporter